MAHSSSSTAILGEGVYEYGHDGCDGHPMAGRLCASIGPCELPSPAGAEVDASKQALVQARRRLEEAAVVFEWRLGKKVAQLDKDSARHVSGAASSCFCGVSLGLSTLHRYKHRKLSLRAWISIKLGVASSREIRIWMFGVCQTRSGLATSISFPRSEPVARCFSKSEP